MRFRRKVPSAARLTRRRWRRWQRYESLTVTPRELAEANGLRFHDEPTSARWIEDSLRPWPIGRGKGLRFCVPEGFDAYARLLHPAHRHDRGPTRWAEVAEWSGNPLHATSSFESIGIRSDGETWCVVGSSPEEGALPETTTDRLAEVMVRHTGTHASGWFCLWDGYGDLDGSAVKDSSLVQTPGRTYWLFSGRLSAVGGLRGRSWTHSPQIWWPDDRAWVIVTEIDARSTYVAGSVACIEDLFDEADLEAFPASLDDPFDGGGDPRALEC